MFQGSPEIHTIGTNLDFRTHGCFSLGEEHRNFHDYVVAAVTVWFGIFDIVFYFDDGDVVLFGNEIRNGVDIINKSTDNTDTGYVIELVLDILGSEVVTQFFQFLVDTFRFFDSGLDKRDWVTFIFYGKFIIENFQFGTYLTDSTAVHHHQIIKSCGIFDKNLWIWGIQPGVCIFFSHGILW